MSVFVLENVRIGRDVTEGLRISHTQPQFSKPELTEQHPNFNSAVESYRKTQSFDRVEKKMIISEEIKQKIQAIVNNA